ncbi:hypothetical protein IFVP182_C1170089 [Vibrio parahaemolyticus]
MLWQELQEMVFDADSLGSNHSVLPNSIFLLSSPEMGSMTLMGSLD